MSNRNHCIFIRNKINPNRHIVLPSRCHADGRWGQDTVNSWAQVEFG